MNKAYAMQVYRAVGIITMITTEQALELSMILATVREHGSIVLRGGTSQKPFTREAYDILRKMAGYNSSTEMIWKELISTEGTNERVTKLTKDIYNAATKDANIEEAERYMQGMFSRRDVKRNTE